MVKVLLGEATIVAPSFIPGGSDRNPFFEAKWREMQMRRCQVESGLMNE
jgi:hypothetical protein